MKTFIAAAFAAAASAVSNNMDFKFMQYLMEHGKSYTTVEEFMLRKELFAITDELIEAHNRTEASYTLGHNHLSDWTRDEYATLRGKLPDDGLNFAPVFEAEADENADTPIDWRSKGAVTGVKDQKQCGSCWAFSSTGAMEGIHKIKTGKLLSFSEQELVDCSTANHGCNGGWQYKAFQFYEKDYADAESAYAYTARDGTCKYSTTKNTGVKASSYTNVKANDVNSLKAALAKQPVSISVDAEARGWQNYRSGILDSNCGTRLDHAVLMVGWGKSGSQEYWIVKNSWGTSWGEKGYIRLAIQSGQGVCGCQMEPLYPTSN